MKRFKSAFAVASGFAVAGKPAATVRKADATHRKSEGPAIAPSTAKLRAKGDIRDRAA